MGEGKRQAVLAALAQYLAEGLRGKRGELVNVEVEGWVGGLRIAAHGGEVELRDEEAPQELCGAVANGAFGKVHDKDTMLVHDSTDVKGRCALPQYVAGEGRGKELADFVEDRSDGFAAVAVRPGAKVFYPVGADFGVSHLGNDVLAVLLTDEHTPYTQKGSVGGVEKRGNGVVYELFHAAFSPRIFPDVLKGGHESVSHKRPVVLWDVREGIKRNGVLAVRDVEVEHVLHALRWDVVKECLRVGAMGINEGKAVALGNVADDEIFEHGGLARASLAYHVEVVGAVSVSNTEGVSGVEATIAER